MRDLSHDGSNRPRQHTEGWARPTESGPGGAQSAPMSARTKGTVIRRWWAIDW